MKKHPNLAEDREIQQLHARQASRAERLANLRKMQKERQEKMQPRTPSPSTLDTEAVQRETERQREEAVACGRRVLTYEEWEREENEKKEKEDQAKKRKAWTDKEIARRRRQEQRGEEREATLRSEGARSSRALIEEEWLKMQAMAEDLPSPPPRPQRYDEAKRTARRVIVVEEEHGMAPHQAHQGRAQPQGPLPGPPPPGFCWCVERLLSRWFPDASTRGLSTRGATTRTTWSSSRTQWQQRAPPGPNWRPGAPEQQHKRTG